VSLGPAGAVLFEGIRGMGFELDQQTRPERPDLVGWWPRPRGLGEIAGLPAALEPPLDGPERHQELVGDLGPGYAAIHGVKDSDPEILRIGLHTHSMPERATFQANRCTTTTSLHLR
jgi:hypothetical protein